MAINKQDLKDSNVEKIYDNSSFEVSAQDIQDVNTEIIDAEVVGAENIGDGAEVYIGRDESVGNDGLLKLRSITASGSATVTQDSESINIHVSETGEGSGGSYVEKVLPAFSGDYNADVWEKITAYGIKDLNPFAGNPSIYFPMIADPETNKVYRIVVLNDGTGISDTSRTPIDLLVEIDDQYELLDNLNSFESGIYEYNTLVGKWQLIAKNNEVAGSSEVVVVEDIESKGVGTVGGIDEGDIVPQGSTITQFVKQLIQKVVNPTYTNPTSNVSSSPNSKQEIGSQVTYTITPSFNQNDAGSLEYVTIYRNDVELSYTSGAIPYVDSDRVVEAGTSEYKAKFDYAQGDVKNDNFGDAYPTGRIEAGSIESIVGVSGAYYKWFGSLPLEPSLSSDVRSLSNSFSNSFELQTGSTDTVMSIAVPSTNNLISVIDLDALNANITSDYILSTTLTQIEDGGGNLVSYKVYVLNLAIPYSSNHRHAITIS